MRSVPVPTSELDLLEIDHVADQEAGGISGDKRSSSNSVGF